MDYPSIIKAREKDSILTIEAYCRGDCAVREVEMYVKDFDNDFLKMLGEAGLSCPLCGTPLTIHWAKPRNVNM